MINIGSAAEERSCVLVFIQFSGFSIKFLSFCESQIASIKWHSYSLFGVLVVVRC